MKKKMMGICFVGFFAALLTAGAASATDMGDMGVSAEVGTTGAGAHFSVPLQQNLNARFGFGYLTYTHDGSTTDMDYRFKLKLQTIDALLDYYPITNSGFRITGGVVLNGNKVTANAKPNSSGTYTINGNTYSASDAGDIDGKIDFRNVAPYVGIGWGNAVSTNEGWGFTSDIGVIYQGSAKSSLTNSGCTAGAAVCDQLASDLRVENDNLNDKGDDLKLYPVVRVGVNYRF